MSALLNVTQATEVRADDVRRTAAAIFDQWCGREQSPMHSLGVIDDSPVRTPADGQRWASVLVGSFTVSPPPGSSRAGFDEDTVPFRDPALERVTAAYGEKVVAALKEALGEDGKYLGVTGRLRHLQGGAAINPTYQVELHSTLDLAPERLAATMAESRATVRLALERNASGMNRAE